MCLSLIPKTVKGTIIFLNGVSSSGKSTLAKEIIRLRPDYFHMSADDYADWVNSMEDKPHRLIPMETEHFFNRTVAMFSDAGVNVVVDDILHNELAAKDSCTVLESYPVLFVGVHCSVEELERREKARGDRRMGLARGQLSFVHVNEVYDVEVNTHDESPAVCAERVVKVLKSLELPAKWRETCARHLHK